MELLSTFQEFGLLGLMVGAFVLLSKQREDRYLSTQEKANTESIEREKRLNERLNDLQKGMATLQQEMTEQLMGLVERCNQVIADNTAAMTNLKNEISSLFKRGDK